MITFLRLEQRRLLQSLSHQRYNQAAARPLPVFDDDTADVHRHKQQHEHQHQDEQYSQQTHQHRHRQQQQPITYHKHQANNKHQAYERDELDLTFNNTRTAFKSKRFSELLRNYIVLGLCSSSYLVRNNETLMRVSRRLLGKRGFETLMRATFYGQFVAGKDELEIQPTIAHLSRFGVKALIDYSAEEDVSGEQKQHQNKDDGAANERDVAQSRQEFEALAVGGSDASGSQQAIGRNLQSSLRQYQLATDFADRRKYSPVARTYFYHGESQCEKNLEIFFRGVEAVADATNNTGLVAIKLTALGRPQLLMKLSKIVDYMNEVNCGDSAEFSSVADLMNKFKTLDEKFINALDEDEEEMLCNLMRRVNRIAAYAHEKKVRCMIDAEQTYMQPAINMIALELMREYNKDEAIVFNTYQCYLKSAFASVERDLSIAQRGNFFFGAKLVRGAYMEQERQRAKRLNYADPINDSFEETTRMYEKTLAHLIDEIVHERSTVNQASNIIDNHHHIEGEQKCRISIMVASHNEDTVRFAVKLMASSGIKPDERVICFGQLFGMCDHVSFTLGQAGYSVYKYMPYGPLEEVLPYLGRRAIENHGFLHKLQRERQLLARELLNRLATMRLLYKPYGNYKPA